MRYDVLLDCVNGRSARLVLCGDNHEQVIQKASDILRDNDGGTAEITAYYGDFYTIIEV